ncbi:membrane protein [Microbacterium phage Cece]|nr:membrane protein [Microbacterium phage Cece]
MSTLIFLAVVFILLLVGVVVLFYLLRHRQKFVTENRQIQIDFEINRAIDRGDHAEVERLREEKIELMLYG